MNSGDDLTPEIVALVDAALVDRFEANRVLPIKDVARLFGVSRRTVERLIADGALEHTRIGSGRGRIGVRQSAAIAYLQSHSHGGQANASS